MISRRLLKSFRFTFSVASGLGVLPFDYNRRKNTLKVSQEFYKRVGPNLVALVFTIRAAYIIFELASNAKHLSDNIRETCLMGLQFVIFWDNACFMRNSWKNRHVIAWIFNQISDYNKGKTASSLTIYVPFLTRLATYLDVELPKKSKLTDKIMLMWTPGHFNIFMQLLTDFRKHPHGKQHIFSLLTMELQDIPSIFRIFLVYEGFTLFSFVWSALFEFSTQVFFMKSLVNWTNQIA